MSEELQQKLLSISIHRGRHDIIVIIPLGFNHNLFYFIVPINIIAICFLFLIAEAQLILCKDNASRTQ